MRFSWNKAFLCSVAIALLSVAAMAATDEPAPPLSTGDASGAVGEKTYEVLDYVAGLGLPVISFIAMPALIGGLFYLYGRLADGIDVAYQPWFAYPNDVWIIPYTIAAFLFATVIKLGVKAALDHFAPPEMRYASGSFFADSTIKNYLGLTLKVDVFHVIAAVIIHGWLKLSYLWIAKQDAAPGPLDDGSAWTILAGPLAAHKGLWLQNKVQTFLYYVPAKALFKKDILINVVFLAFWILLLSVINHLPLFVPLIVLAILGGWIGVVSSMARVNKIFLGLAFLGNGISGLLLTEGAVSWREWFEKNLGMEVEKPDGDDAVDNDEDNGDEGDAEDQPDKEDDIIADEEDEDNEQEDTAVPSQTPTDSDKPDGEVTGSEDDDMAGPGKLEGGAAASSLFVAAISAVALIVLA